MQKAATSEGLNMVIEDEVQQTPVVVGTYHVEHGLQTLLTIAVEKALSPRIEDWRQEIESGYISEELRNICIAMRWITQRDVRVKRVEG